jgi:hypothetical protein
VKCDTGNIRSSVMFCSLVGQLAAREQIASLLSRDASATRATFSSLLPKRHVRVGFLITSLVLYEVFIRFCLSEVRNRPSNNQPPPPQLLIRPRLSATRSITRNGHSRCANSNRLSNIMRPRYSSCSCFSLLRRVSIHVLHETYVCGIVDRKRTRKMRRRWRTFISRMEEHYLRMLSRRILFLGRNSSSNRRVVRLQKVSYCC